MSSIDLVQGVASWGLRLEHQRILSFSANVANANSASPKVFGENLVETFQHMQGVLHSRNEQTIARETASGFEISERDSLEPIALDQQVANMVEAESRFKALVEMINRKSALKNAVMMTQR